MSNKIIRTSVVFYILFSFRVYSYATDMNVNVLKVTHPNLVTHKIDDVELELILNTTSSYFRHDYDINLVFNIDEIEDDGKRDNDICKQYGSLNIDEEFLRSKFFDTVVYPQFPISEDIKLLTNKTFADYDKTFEFLINTMRTSREKMILENYSKMKKEELCHFSDNYLTQKFKNTTYDLIISDLILFTKFCETSAKCYMNGGVSIAFGFYSNSKTEMTSYVSLYKYLNKSAAPYDNNYLDFDKTDKIQLTAYGIAFMLSRTLLHYFPNNNQSCVLGHAGYAENPVRHFTPEGNCNILLKDIYYDYQEFINNVNSGNFELAKENLNTIKNSTYGNYIDKSNFPFFELYLYFRDDTSSPERILQSCNEIFSTSEITVNKNTFTKDYQDFLTKKCRYILYGYEEED